MKNEITNHTEALIWALALALNATTKPEYLEAMRSVDRFASCHFPSEVEAAKKQALLLVDEWEKEFNAIFGQPPSEGAGRA
ncbi:MAG: hypothetical protein JWQ83_2260 [Lacunisphaera sp.]|nr:hypothetical protein [Lacunisphaera sp.]